MSSKFYFLSPVEVMKVSTSNLEEVAEWCGGRVAQTESRRVPGRMDSYVWVPTPNGTKISWAFPGMYITKRLVRSVKDELKATYAVFRKDYFSKNYFESPQDAVNQTWDSGKKVAKKPKPEAPKDVKVKVQQKGTDATAIVNTGELEGPAEAIVEQVMDTVIASGQVDDTEAGSLKKIIKDAVLQSVSIDANGMGEITSVEEVPEEPTLYVGDVTTAETVEAEDSLMVKFIIERGLEQVKVLPVSLRPANTMTLSLNEYPGSIIKVHPDGVVEVMAEVTWKGLTTVEEKPPFEPLPTEELFSKGTIDRA
jgi:hypothetical protein